MAMNLGQFRTMLDIALWEGEIERDRMTAAMKEARRDLLIRLYEERDDV